MENICDSVIKSVFGNKCGLLLCKKIKDGHMNNAFKIICNQYPKPLFLKVEKPFNAPRTQKFQIKKEIAGLTLCKNAEISVPTIIKYDEDGNIFKFPWILEEFIDDRLICEYTLNEQNRDILGREFEDIYLKISSIKSKYYGDTYLNGYLGQHSTWYAAISQITKLLFEDCMEINTFGDNADIVNSALNKALSDIKSNTQSVFYHSDLFSANIMGYENNIGEIHISYIIDFGMSLFAPIGYSQYQTRKLTDFKISTIDLNKIYGIKNDELIAYDILRIEPILIMNILDYNNYRTETLHYTDKCKKYILN